MQTVTSANINEKRHQNVFARFMKWWVSHSQPKADCNTFYSLTYEAPTHVSCRLMNEFFLLRSFLSWVFRLGRSVVKITQSGFTTDSVLLQFKSTFFLSRFGASSCRFLILNKFFFSCCLLRWRTILRAFSDKNRRIEESKKKAHEVLKWNPFSVFHQNTQKLLNFLQKFLFLIILEYKELYLAIEHSAKNSLQHKKARE